MVNEFVGLDLWFDPECDNCPAVPTKGEVWMATLGMAYDNLWPNIQALSLCWFIFFAAGFFFLWFYQPHVQRVLTLKNVQKLFKRRQQPKLMKLSTSSMLPDGEEDERYTKMSPVSSKASKSASVVGFDENPSSPKGSGSSSRTLGANPNPARTEKIKEAEDAETKANDVQIEMDHNPTQPDKLA